jgi:hypothetical protein
MTHQPTTTAKVYGPTSGDRTKTDPALLCDVMIAVLLIQVVEFIRSRPRRSIHAS